MNIGDIVKYTGSFGSGHYYGEVIGFGDKSVIVQILNGECLKEIKEKQVTTVYKEVK